jgi:hypothetical protein
MQHLQLATYFRLPRSRRTERAFARRLRSILLQLLWVGAFLLLPASLLLGAPTTRVSVALDGSDGEAGSVAVAISADGRYVAFQSQASNLVAGDPAHAYAGAGLYTVALWVGNAGGEDVEVKARFVRIAFLDTPIAPVDPADHWALQQILACVAAGSVGGYSDGTYRPASLVTRDAMAVFMARAMTGGDSGVPAGPALASFTDVPTGHWAFRYVEYLRREGVAGGYGDGTYRPLAPVTRDAMAVYVQRAFGLPM